MITFKPLTRLHLLHKGTRRPVMRFLWLDRGVNTGDFFTLSLN
jgi:hypothetical protein